jgi:hypothetical protein
MRIAKKFDDWKNVIIIKVYKTATAKLPQMIPFLLTVACISIKINEIPIGRKNILTPTSYLDGLI